MVVASAYAHTDGPCIHQRRERPLSARIPQVVSSHCKSDNCRGALTFGFHFFFFFFSFPLFGTDRLYSRGHKEEAAAILARLHSRNNDINSPLIQLEMHQIESHISLSGADQRWWDLRSLFRTRNYRYRFGMTVIIACWGQVDGQGLVVCKWDPKGPYIFVKNLF